MRFSTAFEWLSWIAKIHVTEIELGLDRVKQVAAKLNLLSPKCPVIIVGGTNGKGSTVAGLESIYRAAGYKTAAFTSPMLFKHNEQVRINGQETADEAFCLAFEEIETTRGEISLTPFEYHTLAALIIFRNAQPDVMILEVGMGGRLDAVNILDADVAIVTSISLDHTDWLGTTREQIAHEKAGIFRANRPAIIGEADAPMTLINDARAIGANIYQQGRDFSFDLSHQSWAWKWDGICYEGLPQNSLLTQNMALVLMGVALLQDRLSVRLEFIRKGLKEIYLPGRIQVIAGSVVEIFDVSHNQASVALLAQKLKDLPCIGKTYAVFSMLQDKNIAASVGEIAGCIDEWFCAPLTVKRAAPIQHLESALKLAAVKKHTLYTNIEDAYKAAKAKAVTGDRIIVFGSFHTIADVWRYREKHIKD